MKLLIAPCNDLQISNCLYQSQKLSEAVEVLQVQVDEYERGIRNKKESSKLRGSVSRMKGQTPRKSVAFESEISLSKLGVGSSESFGAQQYQQSASKGLSLEAAFYRPALRAARSDAVAWRVKTMEQSISKMEPLVLSDASKISDLSRCSQELLMASNQTRLDKASVRILDIKHARRPRARIQLQEEQKLQSSLERLREASLLARQCFAKLQ